MPPSNTDPLVDELVRSMPAGYAEQFDEDARARHAELVVGRRPGAVAVGSFPTSREDAQAICVVADDRPGLLATISAALIDVGLNVLDATAFTRSLGGGAREAVDVFWVRGNDQQRPAESDVKRLEERLIELLAGDRSVAHTKVAAMSAETETRVRFIEDDAGLLSTLEVETDDRSGLLLAISQALFSQRVQIVGSEVRTIGRGVSDRFTLTELDGSAISPGRRLEIQVAILSAIGPTGEHAARLRGRSAGAQSCVHLRAGDLPEHAARRHEHSWPSPERTTSDITLARSTTSAR